MAQDQKYGAPSHYHRKDLRGSGANRIWGSFITYIRHPLSIKEKN